jgi:hypothetical protein
LLATRDKEGNFLWVNDTIKRESTLTEKMFVIIRETISIDSVIDKVEFRKAGSINTFIGVVREFTEEKKTIKFFDKNSRK